MKKLHESNCNDLWRRVVETEGVFHAARAKFFSACRPGLVGLMRLALSVPYERVSALGIIKLLTIEERQLLLPELLSLASFNHGLTAAARDVVLALPHQWLIDHIEEASEPLLQFNNYEEYQGLFKIYIELDVRLANKLAKRASKHPNADIQDAAQHFFEALRLKGP